MHFVGTFKNTLNISNLYTTLNYYTLVDSYNYLRADNFSPNTVLTEPYTKSLLNTFNTRLRESNSLLIRSSAKESIVTYNALRKVFKARFDEGRANLRIHNIVSIFPKLPFINMPRVPLEVLLYKNSSKFFKTSTYNEKFNNTFSEYFLLDSLTNYYLTDIPFLKSLKSDASRYI